MLMETHVRTLWDEGELESGHHRLHGDAARPGGPTAGAGGVARARRTRGRARRHLRVGDGEQAPHRRARGQPAGAAHLHRRLAHRRRGPHHRPPRHQRDGHGPSASFFSFSFLFLFQV